MNRVYMGKIGDGKTYHVVRNELVPAVKAGRRIYTNIDGFAEGPALRRLCEMTGKRPDEIKVTRIEKKADWVALLTLDEDDKDGRSLKIEKESLVAVDEAQLVWDARDFKNTTKGFTSLLELHRHFGLDFVFITQNHKRLESAIRALCNECYQVKNLGFLSKLAGSRYVMHVRQTPDSDITFTSRGKLDPEYFQLYRSAVQHSRFGRLSGSALSTPLLVLGVSVIAFVLFAGYRRVSGFGGKKKNGVASSTAVGVGPKKDLAVGLRDSLADSRTLKADEDALRLKVATAEANPNQQSGKTCVMKKVHSSYRIVFRGQTDEGQSDRYEPVCF